MFEITDIFNYALFIILIFLINFIPSFFQIIPYPFKKTYFLQNNLKLIKLTLIQMAFVFRGQRKTEIKKELNPGPGSYEFNNQKQTKLPKAFVPFGSMEPKLRAFSEHRNQNPGVGSYNIDMKSNGQKIIVSSQTQDIKILQISRPNPVFKSSTIRFKGQNQQETPGPGDYEISQAFMRNKIYSVGGPSNKSKVIEHLINLNKYQSIPSIPSNIHAFGYNDALQLNQPPVQVLKGEKGDTVGPGHYEPKVQVVKPRGISWSQPKNKKPEVKKEQNQNLGPGSYEIKTMQPLYAFKPSPGFASKTTRSTDQRKGYIPNENKVQQKVKESRITQNPAESRIYSEKAPPSTHVGDSDSDDDSIEYIEDTTPGPGAYEVHTSNSITTKKFYPHRQKSSFGVSAKRFVNKQPETANIGPGQYHQEIQPRKFRSKTIKPDKQDNRFPGLVDVKGAQLIPGPGTYEPRNTMQDKLIYKIQRGYRGQFGSTQARSKDQYVLANDEPGPGHYDPQHIVDQKTSYAIFKSTTERKGFIEPNTNPSPSTYSINHYDIATKVIKEQEEDPDLVIKKPGFGVGQKRFKQLPVKIPQQDFEDDDIIKEIQEKYREEKKRKNLKPSAPFKNKEPRFTDKGIKKDAPGPGAYYDGQEDYWNKRTYNILFADI